MLAVIGLGQAGSNIAEEAEKQGILSGAINFSQKDLDSVNVKYKLRLLGSEGVGKRRNEAIELFKEQWNVVTSFIEDNFNHVQVLVFVFSSGGGSGSGIAPILIDIVSQTMPNKTLIAFPILPDKTEIGTSQINSINTIQELSNLEIAISPIDNEQIRLQYGEFGKNKIYETVNKKFISLLVNLFSYPQKTSKNGNFDQKDLITTFKTKGLCLITETIVLSSVSDAQLSIKGMSKKIQESWKDGLFPLNDYSKLVRSAIIFDGNEKLLEYIRSNTVFSIFSNKPLEVFEGYYHESNGKIITILMGLSWNQNRFSEIQEIANIDKLSKEADHFKFNVAAPYYLTERKESKIPVMDILSKYKR